MTLIIRQDDLEGPEIAALLAEHVADMRIISPPDSIHALDLDALRAPNITFWTAWHGQDLLGCGALKELSPQHGEVKSMRTARQHLRKGISNAILQKIIHTAQDRSYLKLSLETGAIAAFQPAHALYQQAGFRRCAPFADYCDDPHSIFMRLDLTQKHKPKEQNKNT